jgi:hypothetical protein
METTMSNIIQLHPNQPEPAEDQELVWECVCGNAVFYLYEAGHVECADCGLVSTGIGCYDRDV